MTSTYLLLLFVGSACAFTFGLPELPEKMDEISATKTEEPASDLDCVLSGCRPHHHHHFRPPRFLKKVSYRARREFYRIVYNKDTTANQKIKLLDDWAKKQGDDILNDLHDYEKKVHKWIEKVHTGVVNTVKAIPDSYQKVHEIMANKDLTPRQIWEKLIALKLDPVVARSLRAIYFFVVHQKSKGMEDFQLTPAIGLGGYGGNLMGEDREGKVVDEDLNL